MGRKENAAGSQRAGTMVAALVLAALVPAVGVLWFMTVAMRNEHLAVQEQLAKVYANHLVSLQRKVGALWQERQSTLQKITDSTPAETFAAIIRANLADSAVIHDDAGRLLYPRSSTLPPAAEERGEWAAARALEFQRQDHVAAASAYAQLAASSRDIHAKARALQSQAGCLLKAGQTLAAFVPLSQVAADVTLRKAVSAQGTLIAPNAQLLLLKLLAEEPSSEARRALRAETMSRLVERLNDYATEIPASQRTFLMKEVQTLAPNSETFSTLAAEELAAAFLDSDQAAPSGVGARGDGKFPRRTLPGVWQIATSDRGVVALFREERVKTEIAALLDSLSLPDVQVKLLAPGEAFATSKLVTPREVGDLLPGWQLGLSFKGADPLTTASARQARFYLWSGSLVVLLIALLAWFVARYVSAQMRLARLKNELVSTVSHELKTPLASMRALVDTLVAGRYRDQTQLQEYLTLIARENLRLSRLIENFLTFSRLERGKQQFRFEELAPESVMADAVDSLKDRLNASHCSFDRQVAADLPRIRGDASALSTVLVNLLDNAYKYTERDKRISARAYANDQHVFFEVEDNGIGFAQSEVKKIFQRFYQVDQSLTRQRGGCGLGLGIVNHIVRAHQGEIQVVSEPGKGSTFRVKIPLAVPSA